jgi:hypothetical protein
MTISLPAGVEIVPRMWIGSNASCDWARRNLNFTCINVGLSSHTTDPRCTCIPLCPGGGRVDNTALVSIERLLIGIMPGTGLALLHCGQGLTYSPLAMALWLQLRYNITLTQAYQWVLDKRPTVQVLMNLTPPLVATPVQGSPI